MCADRVVQKGQIWLARQAHEPPGTHCTGGQRQLQPRDRSPTVARSVANPPVRRASHAIRRRRYCGPAVLAPSRPITTVIADDHAVVRDGLRSVLERTGGEFAVVAEAADLPATLDAVRTHRPHLLILDVTLPVGSSLGLIPDLLAEHPQLAITVLTMHEDPGYARAALAAGAQSFVLKQAEPDEQIGRAHV